MTVLASTSVSYSFVPTDYDPDETYYLYATDLSGANYSDPATVNPGMDPPTLGQGSIGSTSVVLDYTDLSGASLELYVKGPSDNNFYALEPLSPTLTSVTVDSLSASSSYEFEIDAYTDDQDSGSGAPIDVMTGVTYYQPQQPTIVSVVADPDEATVEPLEDYVGGTLGACLVYRVTFDDTGDLEFMTVNFVARTADDKYQQANRLAQQFTTFISSSGDQYVYDVVLLTTAPVQMQAVIYEDGYVMAPPSAQFSVDPVSLSSYVLSVIPDALTLTATPDSENPDTEVDLSWTGWNTLGVSGYPSTTEIFEVSDGTVSNIANPYSVIDDTVTGTDGTYTASAGPAGSEFFAIAQRNIGGSEEKQWYSAYSDFVKGSGSDSDVTPNAPTSLTADAIDGNDVILHWQDNSDNEDYFEIDMDAGGNDWISVGTVGADATTDDISLSQIQSALDDDTATVYDQTFEVVAEDPSPASGPATTQALAQPISLLHFHNSNPTSALTVLKIGTLGFLGVYGDSWISTFPSGCANFSAAFVPNLTNFGGDLASYYWTQSITIGYATPNPIVGAAAIFNRDAKPLEISEHGNNNPFIGFVLDNGLGSRGLPRNYAPSAMYNSIRFTMPTLGRASVGFEDGPLLASTAKLIAPTKIPLYPTGAIISKLFHLSLYPPAGASPLLQITWSDTGIAGGSWRTTILDATLDATTTPISRVPATALK